MIHPNSMIDYLLSPVAVLPNRLSGAASVKTLKKSIYLRREVPDKRFLSNSECCSLTRSALKLAFTVSLGSSPPRSHFSLVSPVTTFSKLNDKESDPSAGVRGLFFLQVRQLKPQILPRFSQDWKSEQEKVKSPTSGRGAGSPAFTATPRNGTC